MWKYFPRAFTEASDGSATAALQLRLKANTQCSAPKTERYSIEKTIQGGEYKILASGLLARLGLPVSMLPVVVSGIMPRKAKGSMNNLTFEFAENSVFLSWREGEEANRIEIGLDGEIKESVMTLGTFRYITLSYGKWLDEHTLFIEVRPIETPVRRLITFTFKRNRASIKISSVPTVTEFAFGYMGEILIKPTKFVRAILSRPLKLMEPTLHAKCRK
jgi:hypothetical protein